MLLKQNWLGLAQLKQTLPWQMSVPQQSSSTTQAADALAGGLQTPSGGQQEPDAHVPSDTHDVPLGSVPPGTQVSVYGSQTKPVAQSPSTAHAAPPAPPQV